MYLHNCLIPPQRINGIKPPLGRFGNSAKNEDKPEPGSRMTDADRAAEVEAEFLRNIQTQLDAERAKALEALEKEREEYPKD